MCHCSLQMNTDGCHRKNGFNLPFPLTIIIVILIAIWVAKSGNLWMSTVLFWCWKSCRSKLLKLKLPNQIGAVQDDGDLDTTWAMGKPAPPNTLECLCSMSQTSFLYQLIPFFHESITVCQLCHLCLFSLSFTSILIQFHHLIWNSKLQNTDHVKNLTNSHVSIFKGTRHCHEIHKFIFLFTANAIDHTHMPPLRFMNFEQNKNALHCHNTQIESKIFPNPI